MGRRGGRGGSSHLALSSVKVIVYENVLKKRRDWIRVLIGLHLHYLDELLHHISPPLDDEHCEREVPEQVLCVDLDAREVEGGHEQVDEFVASIVGVWVVEKDKEGPVEKPGALLKLDQWGGKGLVVCQV